jgi:hypothetical protein
MELKVLNWTEFIKLNSDLQRNIATGMKAKALNRLKF